MASKKFPVLEHIFNKYYDDDKSPEEQEVIDFYLSDISEGYDHSEHSEPASISNTILDLTRKDTGIERRVPELIRKKGYDLRKKTGDAPNGENYAGEFVYVGEGNAIDSWLRWPGDEHGPDEEVVTEANISSDNVPSLTRRFLRKDEAALFSVIDYTDTLSEILFGDETDIHRIQQPLKWQPNEIDGGYIAKKNDQVYIFPVEAKAIVTNDDINKEQLKGGYETVKKKIEGSLEQVTIRTIAIEGRPNGMVIAVFPENEEPNEPEEFYRVRYDPKIKKWS
jgi:hypothetical protein